MTTWESIDKIDMENVTVTSDVAFERVTSDEHFVEEGEKSFLKQNTAWLVQEIPNIAFLDIADTTLETLEYQSKDENDDPITVEVWKKTLYQKNNWNVVVGKQWKSIELVPQDTLNIRLWEDKTITSSPALVQLDTRDLTDDSRTIEVDQQHPWRINILMDWYYRISYWWTISTLTATEFSVEIYKNADKAIWEKYSWISWTISWWRTISLSLQKGDYLYMRVDADGSLKVCEEYTYLELQYVRQSI